MAAFDATSFSTSAFSPLAFDFGAAGFVLTVEPASFSIDGQQIGLVKTGEEFFSGGFAGYDHGARKRREQRELLEEIRRLERHLGLEEYVDPDIERIKALVKQYDQGPLPNRAKRAFEYAQRAQTEAAYILAEREAKRLQEEEEVAIALLLILD